MYSDFRWIWLKKNSGSCHFVLSCLPVSKLVCVLQVFWPILVVMTKSNNNWADVCMHVSWCVKCFHRRCFHNYEAAPIFQKAFSQVTGPWSSRGLGLLFCLLKVWEFEELLDQSAHVSPGGGHTMWQPTTDWTVQQVRHVSVTPIKCTSKFASTHTHIHTSKWSLCRPIKHREPSYADQLSTESHLMQTN